MRVAWWSAGITSAVACKMELNDFKNTELYYIDTGSAHSDNKRFKEECEEWYKKKYTLLNLINTIACMMYAKSKSSFK